MLDSIYHMTYLKNSYVVGNYQYMSISNLSSYGEIS